MTLNYRLQSELDPCHASVYVGVNMLSSLVYSRDTVFISVIVTFARAICPTDLHGSATPLTVV